MSLEISSTENTATCTEASKETENKEISSTEDTATCTEGGKETENKDVDKQKHNLDVEACGNTQVAENLPLHLRRKEHREQR